MKNGAILVKDIEDTDYVLGVLVLNGKSIDVSLFEGRVTEMFRKLCWNEEDKTFSYEEYDAKAVIDEVLKTYSDYDGMIYIADINEAFV